MSSQSNLTLRIDEDKHIVIFSIKGEINSAQLADDIIDAYKKLATPWTYKRIFDYRRSTGLFEYDEISRVMDCWQSLTRHIPHVSKVAVITSDVLLELRAKTFGEKSPNEDIVNFSSMTHALKWLEETPEATRKAS